MKHCIIHLSCTAVRDAAHSVTHTSLRKKERSLSHVLNTNNKADLCIAKCYVITCNLKCSHTGSAVLVNNACAALYGHTDTLRNLTSRKGTLHGCENFAHNDLINILRIYSCTLDSFSTNCHSKISCADILELAKEFTNGSTAGAYDYYILCLHKSLPPV